MTTPRNEHPDTAARHAVANRAQKRLFRDKRPAEWRREYTEAYDWGPDVGREIVEE